ncbi:cyanophycinase [Francisella orientalis]|uniref:Cyanophycinase n=1 Tax=Francisella orientalis TaxID=299583 RepID=A0AAP7C629_9GAMM|nr:cyanophycinase [Francisella orientalis]AFJ44002.1 peptidase [Francisella orientalis str. Toba 04]AHB98588.1 cyanophycinase [Francisella orientalis LADL 07-285A]AKN85827.1 Cyanophycinase [Francisella orientalis FNO12]AKN87366.1 Cyanophycinase [Francisella orientalis FNO24]AKN88903.1 Cyanophycinase [Francisella orientalis]
MPSKPVKKDHRGYIMPIGGGEDKFASPTVLEKFVGLSGGSEAKIAVIPTASKLPDTGDIYVDIFSKMGVKDVYNLKIETRLDATTNKDYQDLLAQSTGIFMTGGNQLLLSTTLGGTLIAQLIRRLNAKGVNVAGTSAGAAFISGFMIAGGQAGLMPRCNMVNLAPGLGLTNKLLVDQHFSQRDRLGRLLAALSYNPYMVGVGIDEDTSALLNSENVIEVVGSGMVTIIDFSHLKHSSLHNARNNAPISLVDIRMHMLLEGQKFDLNTCLVEF